MIAPNERAALDAGRARGFQGGHPRPGPSEHERSTMKPWALCLCFLILFQIVAHAQIETDIPSTNRVILRFGDWKPSEAETLNALVAIDAFLKDCSLTSIGLEKADAQWILKRLKRYRVQFVGLGNEKERVIWCNFFPAPPYRYNPNRFSYWKNREVRMNDGGPWYWHIKYDPKTGHCAGFLPNGVI